MNRFLFKLIRNIFHKVCKLIEVDYDIINFYFILKHYAARSDFWRYLMLKKFGGIYLDIDSLILKNLKPLYEINRSILTLEPTKTDEKSMNASC